MMTDGPAFNEALRTWASTFDDTHSAYAAFLDACRAYHQYMRAVSQEPLGSADGFTEDKPEA